MSKIKCNFCNNKFGIKALNNHLLECVINSHQQESGYLIEFYGKSSITGKVYILYAILGTKCIFNDINIFLRNTWFSDNLNSSINTYTKNKFNKNITNELFLNILAGNNNKFINEDDIKNFELDYINKLNNVDMLIKKPFDFNDSISKFTRTSKFLVGDEKINLKFQFEYTYNFDNDDENKSTEIYFNIIKKLNGKEKNNNVKLIYQNLPPQLKCECKMNKPINVLDYYLLCSECKILNNDEDNIFLPIINSPHIGLEM